MGRTAGRGKGGEEGKAGERTRGERKEREWTAVCILNFLNFT